MIAAVLELPARWKAVIAVLIVAAAIAPMYAPIPEPPTSTATQETAP